MAPFVYPEYQDRLAGSIADIMGRSGDIAADSARRRGAILAARSSQLGDIEARRSAANSDVWGRAIGGGIQAAGQIPQQAAAMTAQDVQRQSMTADLEVKKRNAADLSALDQAYMAASQANPDDPTAARKAILDSLQKANKGHLVPTVAKSFEESDQAHAAAAKAKEDADAAMTAALARDGMDIRAHGYDPTAAQITISNLKVKYAKDPDALRQINKFQQALLNDPTVDGVRRIVDPILKADKTTRDFLQKEQEDAARKANDEATRKQAEANAAETKRRNDATIANEAATRKQGEARLRIEGENAETAKAREKREQAVYDQTYGAGGTNPDGTPKQRPISAGAKAIGDYKMQPPSPRSRASGAGKAMMEEVLAYNPDYDETQYPTRAKMRAAYTSGNQSQQLTSLNTAIEHLGILDDFATALGNGSFQPGNEIYNKVTAIFGKSAVTNFSFARDIMAGELATAMKKNGATDPEIEKVTGALKSSNSATQLSDAIRSVAVPMIGGKAKVLDEQYHATMGAKDPFSVYTPGAKAVLDNLKPAAKVAPPAKAGGVAVQTPQGLFMFPDQASADKFKAAAGLK